MAGSPELLWHNAYLEFEDSRPLIEKERREEWDFSMLQTRTREIYEDHDAACGYDAPVMIGRVAKNVSILKEILSKDPENIPLIENSVTNIAIWAATIANYTYLDIIDPLSEKYANGCPRCHQMPCTLAEEGECIKNPDAPWGNADGPKPQSLSEWQAHFAKLYPNNFQGEPEDFLKRIITRLGDETEELYRSDDLSLQEDDDRLSQHDIPLEELDAWKGELADVFAWLFGFSEAINRKIGGFSLEKVLKEKYTAGCPFCHSSQCICSNDISIIDKIHEKGPIASLGAESTTLNP